jgi:cysteine desulfurase
MIYLDHAATPPLRAEVRDAWLGAQIVGNASSVHGAGQRARRVLEEARERVSDRLGCQPIEVVFTSGGTESVNLALKGLWSARDEGRSALVLPDGEHHATLDAAAWLAAREGAGVRAVALDRTGRIPLAGFREALDGSAALATALVAANETGTINDAAMLSEAAADAGVPLHLDAVAAAGHVAIDFAEWRGSPRGGAGLVALSISGHKLGAPVGTGALVVSRHAAPDPLLHGGGQQRGLRAGTQDIAGAVALATALELADAERDEENARLETIRAEVVADLARRTPEIVVLGDPERHLAGTIHLHLPGAAGESLMFLLDQRGFSVSTGSACQAGVAEPSHVVMALGYSAEEARQVLRISMGRTTTGAEMARFTEALREAYMRLTSR